MTLEQVETRIASLSRKDRFADSFPLGCGRGGRQRRSNKSIDRGIDASVRRATELVTFYKRRDILAAPTKPERPRPTKEQQQRYALKWFDSLKVGDTYQPGNYPLPIIKKTLAAIFTENCRWSLQELTGIKPKEAAALRAVSETVTATL